LAQAEIRPLSERRFFKDAMNFKKETIGDYYLHDTSIENIFINEYMPHADGAFVKVYIFASMYAGHDAEMTNEVIAKQLSMSVLDVLQAWDYWEKQGVIKKHQNSGKGQFDFTIEFLSLRQLVYHKGKKSKKNDGVLSPDLKDLMQNESVRKMYSDIEQLTGRLFEGSEHQEILSWLKDYKVSPDYVVKAYAYCAQKRNNSKWKYVASVVKEWISQGLITVTQVEDYLSETDNRHFLYRRILKALGLFRHPTEEEKRIMDVWFDEMGCTIETVLEACKKTSGISNPNLNYINSVLKGWKSGDKTRDGSSKMERPNSISIVQKSYEELRGRNEQESEKRRAEVYSKVPRIKEIEEEIRAAGLQLSRIMLSGTSNAQSESARIRTVAEKLVEEKAYMLTENSFPMTYLDMIYECNACNDTGILETGERCRCFAEKLERL
jgi:DnaD/phage-associated family protein